MSHLLRQSVNGAPQPPPHTPTPRPRPSPIAISDLDEHSSSDSSASSADSLASINTVRPSSREQTAPPTYWTSYFAQELYLEHLTTTTKATYHVYLTPPTNPQKGPLFICHHGAGASGLSFALFAQHLRHLLPEAGILSLEARGHGSVIHSLTDNASLAPDYSLSTLTSDATHMINLTQQHLSWPSLPPSILIGHSLGGAITTQLALNFTLGPSLIGYTVLDVVEGSALEALSHMKSHLSSRPSLFASPEEAIDWHVRTRTLRNKESAAISVPSLLYQLPSASASASGGGGGKYVWRTDLSATAPWWEEWFQGMSGKFLQARGAKMLVLAGTDRLDKELMIGQMQGKFQLVVIPEAGHFVQEDVPEKLAGLVVEFFKRNDRSAMVLPPKVADLIAMGKKV